MPNRRCKMPSLNTLSSVQNPLMHCIKGVNTIVFSSHVATDVTSSEIDKVKTSFRFVSNRSASNQTNPVTSCASFSRTTKIQPFLSNIQRLLYNFCTIKRLNSKSFPAGIDTNTIFRVEQQFVQY